MECKECTSRKNGTCVPPLPPARAAISGRSTSSCSRPIREKPSRVVKAGCVSCAITFGSSSMTSPGCLPSRRRHLRKPISPRRRPRFARKACARSAAASAAARAVITAISHPAHCSGDALIDAYLSHVPTRSYAASCIYHGASGCALPRALRSETCTSFLCDGLKAVSESAARHPERAVVGVFELKDRFPPVTRHVMVVHDGRMDDLRAQRRNASE
jgi:hypothetical protein